MKKSLLCILLAATSTQAASFDCAKASSKAEKLICSTPSLSQADDQLYNDYLKAQKTTGNSAEFKNLTKQNWKQREKCTTAACLADWYTSSSQEYKKLSSTNNVCLNAGDAVSLDGLLIRMTYAGAPNYESIENGDEPETYFVLKPDNPIDCANDSPQFGSNKLMQLSVEADDYKKYQDLVGGRTTVIGTLLYSETGHHHTPLMIDTQLIKTASSKAPATVSTPTPKSDKFTTTEPTNTNIPSDNGEIMPLNLRAANQVGIRIDQRYTVKMANCVDIHELSRQGCTAYGAIGIAKAYEAAGYSFRASILDAAKDHGMAYSSTKMRDMIFPFVIAIRTDDGTDFMVKNGVIEASDVPYLRSAFTEQ